MQTNNKLRESMAQVKEIARTIYSTSEKGSHHEDLADKIVEIANVALAAPPRVCDVNTLESLTDFVEKAILASDPYGIAKSIAVASVRTALTIAYEPAALENAASEIRDECNWQEQGENNGSK